MQTGGWSVWESNGISDWDSRSKETDLVNLDDGKNRLLIPILMMWPRQCMLYPHSPQQKRKEVGPGQSVFNQKTGNYTVI